MLIEIYFFKVKICICDILEMILILMLKRIEKKNGKVG